MYTILNGGGEHACALDRSKVECFKDKLLMIAKDVSMTFEQIWWVNLKKE